MEEACTLELFHKGNIYELPAYIQSSDDDYLFYISLPNIDVVFKKQKKGNYKPVLSGSLSRKGLPKIDRGLFKVISSHIEAIIT